MSKMGKHRHYINYCFGMGMGEMGVMVKRYVVSFYSDKKILKLTIIMVVWLNVQKMELYTLNDWIIWNLNYISVKLYF